MQGGSRSHYNRLSIRCCTGECFTIIFNKWDQTQAGKLVKCESIMTYSMFFPAGLALFYKVICENPAVENTLFRLMRVNAEGWDLFHLKWLNFKLSACLSAGREKENIIPILKRTVDCEVCHHFLCSIRTFPTRESRTVYNDIRK